MNFGVALVPKRFLAQIGNALLHVQIGDGEIFQCRGKVENLLADGGAGFKRVRLGLLFKLANLKCALALLADLDLDEFGGTSFEHAAIGNGGRSRSRMACPRGSKREGDEEKEQPRELAPDACHRKTGMRNNEMRRRRAAAVRVAGRGAESGRR